MSETKLDKLQARLNDKGSVATQTPQLTEAEVRAIKQCWAGQATDHQQKVAIATIVNKLSRANDLLYIPGGLEGDRDTAFLNGRAFVGQRISYFLNFPLGQLQVNEEKRNE